MADSSLSRARALLDMGRGADAVEVLQQTLAANPDDLSALPMLAQALLGLGRNAEGLRVAERAIALDPQREWPHRLRALFLLRLRRKREALAAATEAVRQDATVPEALYVLALIQLECRQVGVAQTTADRLVSLAPERDIAHRAAGDVARQRHQWRAAEAHYRRALAIDPNDTAVLNNLAVTLQHTGRHDEAIELLYDAARLAPTAPLYTKNLNQALERKRRRASPVRWVMWATLLLPPLRLIGVVLMVVEALVRPGRPRGLPPAIERFYQRQRQLNGPRVRWLRVLDEVHTAPGLAAIRLALLAVVVLGSVLIIVRAVSGSP